MKIVTPSVNLRKITTAAERHIEWCGRTSMMSHDKITHESCEAFIRARIKARHWSVLEHASATFDFTCDRGVSHEMVRHRVMSFTQMSTRFCSFAHPRFDGQISVIEPPEYAGDTEARDSWWRACQAAEKEYLFQLERGFKPEIARAVLPTCLATTISATANFRQWRHVFQERLHMAAHPHIRSLMDRALFILVEKCPSVFEDYESWTRDDLGRDAGDMT